jgi:hypothetical protein
MGEVLYSACLYCTFADDDARTGAGWYCTYIWRRGGVLHLHCTCEGWVFVPFILVHFTAGRRARREAAREEMVDWWEEGLGLDWDWTGEVDFPVVRLECSAWSVRPACLSVCQPPVSPPISSSRRWVV